MGHAACVDGSDLQVLLRLDWSGQSFPFSANESRILELLGAVSPFDMQVGETSGIRVWTGCIWRGSETEVSGVVRQSRTRLERYDVCTEYVPCGRGTGMG